MAQLASSKVGQRSELAEGEDGQLDHDEGGGGHLGEHVPDPGAVEEEDEEADDARERSW